MGTGLIQGRLIALNGNEKNEVVLYFPFQYYTKLKLLIRKKSIGTAAWYDNG